MPSHAMPTPPLQLDAVLIGGGVAGLWLLGDLARAGYSAILLEARALGAGQTVASQGILHGGLKYTLAGLFTDSADAIKHLPALWRRCLAGQAAPDLSTTLIRAEFCHLWSTHSLKSKLGMFGAAAALSVKPAALPRVDWPALLGDASHVSRLDEQVISPAGLIASLAAPLRDRLLHIDADSVEYECDAGGRVSEIRIRSAAGPAVPANESSPALDPSSQSRRPAQPALRLQPRAVILTAGEGNADLRRRLGLSADAMQRRPLHFPLVRGRLPHFAGHCVDGGHTRLTITSDTDTAGRTVWQLGGQVSEDGVNLTREGLIRHVQAVIADVLPSLDQRGLEWATLPIDRAEGNAAGRRPADAVVLREGNVLTCWPTKLVLAPQASRKVRDLLLPPGAVAFDPACIRDWPRPAVALPPWEMPLAWTPT